MKIKIFVIIFGLFITCQARVITSNEFDTIWLKVKQQERIWFNGSVNMYKGSHYYYNEQEINCHYFNEDELDLNQPIVLDSTISAREVLLLFATIDGPQYKEPAVEGDYKIVPLPYQGQRISNIEDKRKKTADPFKNYKICLLPCQGKLAILHFDDNTKELYSEFDGKEFLDRIPDWKSEDIILSLNYKRFNEIQYMEEHTDEKLNDIIRICRYYQSSLANEEDYTMIVLTTPYPKEILDYKVKGKYIKQLFRRMELTYLRVAGLLPDEEVLDSLAVLSRNLVYNKKIPYKLKSNFVTTYLYHALNNKNDSEFNKEEFFELIYFIISEYSGECFNSYENTSQIDQSVIQYASSAYKKGLITFEELEEFADKVIKIDKNPQVTMLAYCVLTESYLDRKDLETAKEIALTVLNLYDSVIHWRYFKSDVMQNTRPAMMCIYYLFDTCQEPQLIQENIDLFFQNSKQFPEFRENLLMYKFILKSMQSLPNAEVLDGYKEKNYNQYSEYTYEGYNGYNGNLPNTYFYNEAIQLLRDYKPEIRLIDKPVRVKKFLLAEKSELIDFEGSVEIKILLPKAIKLFWSEEYYNRSNNWQKAEINGEIFWILIESDVMHR